MEMFKNKGLCFERFNINNILSKIEQVRSLLINSNISVLGITETKLDDTISNEAVEIDGYNLTRSDRNRMRGGIACYIKTTISFNYHQSLSERFENILIDILLPKSKPVTLGIIYRLPDQSSFIDDCNAALKELASQGNETYFFADCNIKNHTQNLKRLRKTKDCQNLTKSKKINRHDTH